VKIPTVTGSTSSRIAVLTVEPSKVRLSKAPEEPLFASVALAMLLVMASVSIQTSSRLTGTGSELALL